MSKFYKKFIYNSLSSYAEIILTNFISAYRKSYSSNQALLRHRKLEKKLENWNLSKAFDCIPHDLLVAKLHALSEDAVTFAYSYLKRRKPGIKINDIESIFQILWSGITQGPTY